MTTGRLVRNGYISSTGRLYKRKTGRPRDIKKVERRCRHCGNPIRSRPESIKKGKNNFCQDCFNKLFRPPVRIKGNLRAKAGGYICPHCHSFRQAYKRGDEVFCFICGERII